MSHDWRFPRIWSALVCINSLLLGGASDLPARLTAPSSGLFLERVFYDTPPADDTLEPPVFRLLV